ncbi:MAG: DNA recombination/repair protein RecA [Chloroflexi bacterium]|nr:DNA recombination/repair protein RecA [Chloroflexota bacterium]
MSTQNDRLATFAELRSRWGAAAPRPAVEVFGALAVAPLPAGPPGAPGTDPHRVPTGAPGRPVPLPGGAALPAPAPRPDRSGIGAVVPTGFAALDALLGAGGLPRPLTATLAGDPGSGRTTLALRVAAEAQAAGCLVAYVDAARSLDPVEAAARGVRLDELVVVAPPGAAEGIDLGAELLRSGSVDVLFVDLPDRPGRPGDRLPDRLLRLAAIGRRSGALLVLLQPPGLPPRAVGALAEASGLRLRLRRRAWIRLGREVVGQRTEVVVEKERAGPPGRRAELRILYAEGGARDRCLLRDDLLHDRDAIDPHAPSAPRLAGPAHRARAIAHGPLGARDRDAGRRVGGDGAGLGSDRPRRDAVDGRAGPRRQPGGAGDGRPARDAARERAPARA